MLLPRGLAIQPVLDGFPKILNAFTSACCTLARTGSARRNSFLAAFAEAALERIPASADSHGITADYDGIGAGGDNSVCGSGR